MKLIGYLKPFKHGCFTSPVFSNNKDYFYQSVNSDLRINSFEMIETHEDEFITLENDIESEVTSSAIFIFIDSDGSLIIGDLSSIKDKLINCRAYNNPNYPNINKEIDSLIAQVNKNLPNKRNNMLLKKMVAYNNPKKVRELGLYPYYRTIESCQESTVTINGKKILMFGSNNYLGLANHGKLKEASITAINKYGNGTVGSRFLNGTFDLHLEVEEKVAKFVGKENSIIFSTGYQTCIGVISCLPGRHDYIIMDEYNHASLIDAARLSFAKVLKFRHNDMNSLEKILSKCEEDKIKLIIVDGIFSIEGDLAKLPEICDLANKYSANILVDEAHGIGIYGDNGRGVCSHYGLTDHVDLILGTFSKTFGAIGGFIATDNYTIDFLKHNARSLIFSAGLTPSSLACVSAGIDILLEEPNRISNLNSNSSYARQLLKKSGFDINDDTGPIISIYIRDDFKTFSMTMELFRNGVFVNPIVSPAVPSSASMLRFTLMANHTRNQIDEAIYKMEQAARKFYVFDDEKENILLEK